jgi:hypothetical protein
MAGVIFLREYFDLSIDQTVERCLLDNGWQYALNIQPMTASMSHATVERYIRLMAEDDLGTEIFQQVAGELIACLEQDVSRQRLDSTHIESDMAVFGRTRLMAVAIKRFLVQLKRHEGALHDALPAELGRICWRWSAASRATRLSPPGAATRRWSGCWPSSVR